jgi:bifunctional non-homologous end joining protein LigD
VGVKTLYRRHGIAYLRARQATKRASSLIHPCQPIVAKQPPVGPGWAHELKHDGYRLQIHVRDGRVRLYTINGADWSKRYPLIVEAARKIDGSAILDAEVVWLDSDGAANFDALHSRVNDQSAVALAFDLMSLDGEDFRQEPFSERKAVLRKVLRRTRRGIQYVEHAEDHGGRLFKAVCELGLEGIVSKKLVRRIAQAGRKVGSKSKIRNPRLPPWLLMVRSEYSPMSVVRRNSGRAILA